MTLTGGAVRFGNNAQRPRYYFHFTIYRPRCLLSPTMFHFEVISIILLMNNSGVVRTISIAPYPTGIDATFCGIDDTMFKPCATIEYAMNNQLGSFGQWVTYSYWPATYYFTAAIPINYAGVTIKARDGRGTVIFTCGNALNDSVIICYYSH
jgi:hypothetical protein